MLISWISTVASGSGVMSKGLGPLGDLAAAVCSSPHFLFICTSTVSTATMFSVLRQFH